MSFLEETNALTSCIHMFFKLVGWDFAESAKAPDFAEAFQALGVLVNVSARHGGLVTIGNTDVRQRELIQSLLEILRVRRLTRHEALKLPERLQFAAGNILGGIVVGVVTLPERFVSGDLACLALCHTSSAYGTAPANC